MKTRGALDNHLRGILKAYGLKIGKVAPGGFEARMLELVDGDPVLGAAVDAILRLEVIMTGCGRTGPSSARAVTAT